MCAVRLNFPELTRTLLKAKAEVNHTGKDNLTALHVYFERTRSVSGRLHTKGRSKTCEDQNDILKMLLDFGASTEMVSVRNELPLHVALSSYNQDTEAAEILYLLNYSKDCNVMNESGSYPLLLATARGYVQVAKKLIAMGADVKCEDKQKQTVLHHCMGQTFDKELILQCTAKGANINAFQMSGYTPLAIYIMYSKFENLGNSPLVDNLRFLLENGANPDVCTANGYSALMIAVEIKMPDIMFRLIDEKGHVNHISKNGTTALHMFLEKGEDYWNQTADELWMLTDDIIMKREEIRDIYKDFICSLVEAGADVNIVDDNGQSPIYTLISMNDKDRCDQLLPLLLTKDANVNCGVEVPLIIAAKNGDYKVIDTLLKAGAEVNKTDKNGDTALTAVLGRNKTKNRIESGTAVKPLTRTLQSQSFMIERNVLKVVDYLLEAGAEPNPYKSGTDRDSPLIEAIKMQLTPVALVLLTFGADPNHIGNNNLTALQTYILEKDTCDPCDKYHVILDFLLEYKVDVNLTDTHDFPLVMAIERGQVDTVRTLLTAFPDAAADGGYTQEAFQKCLCLDMSKAIAMIDLLLEFWRPDVIQENFVNDFLDWLISKNELENQVGLLEKITVMLISHSTIEIRNMDKNKDSPLIYFTKYGSANIVGLLLEKNQDVNHIGVGGRTALHHVVQRLVHNNPINPIDVFDIIWAQKPNLFIKDDMGKSPVDVLFDAYNGYQPNYLSEIAIRFIASDGLPVRKIITEAFQRSSEKGDFNVMSALLPYVPDANQVCKYSGDTVLHTCWRKQPVSIDEVIQFVLSFKKAGGSLTKQNRSGISPLISLLKSQMPDEDIVRVVQCFVADEVLQPSQKDRRFPLHVAVERGLLLTVVNANSVQIVEQLIEHCDQTKLSEVFGDDILVLLITNSKDAGEKNPALRSGLVSLLIKNGADPNKHNSKNIPLHCAAGIRDVLTMDVLNKGGSNINAINDKGQNALHKVYDYTRTMVEGSLKKAVTFLLQSGIDVNLQDASGTTPLMMAVNAGYHFKKEIEDVVQLLLDDKANVHLLDKQQKSALDIFCSTGKHLGIGKLLVNAGASPKNCLALAISNNNLKRNEGFEFFLQMLLDKGADPNTSTYSKPCLIEATEMSMINVVRRMCQCGVDVNSKYCSRSALHHACELAKDKKREELVKLLLDHGASLTSDEMCPLEAYAKSLTKDLGFFREDELTSEETQTIISIDLSLLNIMLQGGKDLNTATTTDTENSYSYRNTKSTLQTLIKSGFFMAAENMVKCGLNLENEKWLKSFDLDSFDMSNIHLSSRSLKRQDVDERKIKLSEALTGGSVKCTGIQSLSCHCRSVIRNALSTASKGAEILSKIEELPVPKQIKTFLSLGDGLHASEIIVVEIPIRQKTTTNLVFQTVPMTGRRYYVTDTDDNYGYRSQHAVYDRYYDYDDYDSPVSSYGYDSDDY